MARNFWYFFLVPGVIMLLVGIMTGIRAEQFRLTAKHVRGTVVFNRYTVDNEGSGTYYPEVEYETPDGMRRKFSGSVGSSPAAFSVGEKVDILYAEGDPSSAAIDTFFQQFFLPLLFTGMGLIFALVGGIPLYLRAKREKVNDWLKLNGRAIQADLGTMAVRQRTNFEVNGRSPYRISVQWLNPATNAVHVFESEDLWFDPAPYLLGTTKKVTVLIDPNNPTKYWMDTSFLPKLAG